MIDALFALLNMALLGAFFWYIYQRFLFGRIQHMQLLEHATQLNSMKRQEALRKQEQGLVRAYYHQHYRYEELSKKIELWKRRLEEREQVVREERELQFEIMQQERVSRDQHIAERALCTAALDEALRNVQRDLVHLFADPQQADAYMRTVLATQSRDKGSHEED